MSMTIEQRVKALREWMSEKGIQAFITPSTDPHSGEYVPDHWKSREWISGFTGSAGTAVVTTGHAALWTDNRYFLQAADQLQGTGFDLMKLGLEDTPTIEAWLATVLPQGATVGMDAWCNTSADFALAARRLQARGLRLVDAGDPYAALWADRPALPPNPLEIQPLKWAGETAQSKIGRIRHDLAQQGFSGCVVSLLDEVAWTLNIRGTDVEFNPVAVSYLVITSQKAVLFVNPEKLNNELRQYLAKQNVETQPYEAVETFLRALPEGERIAFQPDKTNQRIAALLPGCEIDECPATHMKIYKNPVEIQGYHSAMIKDGIAMVKWMKWAVEAVEAGGQTELSLSQKLLEFRAEQPLFRGPSFATIMGYAAHGAIVHYEPTPETDIPVLPKGLLLVDSGGQYRDGTTDITRTIPLGPLTYEERRDYTLVLRGFIQLARAVFPRGTCGTQLDALAREPMWKYGINYLHGTGHGVGSYLNVHEGPHQFRMNHMPTPLHPGMTITDEPGIYLTGEHGVRHENTMLVVDAHLHDCPDSQGVTFGPYYQFEQLTLCPIFTTPIIRMLLHADEADWLNDYNYGVYETLAPHLDKEHRLWIQEIAKML